MQLERAMGIETNDLVRLWSSVDRLDFQPGTLNGRVQSTFSEKFVYNLCTRMRF